MSPADPLRPATAPVPRDARSGRLGAVLAVIALAIAVVLQIGAALLTQRSAADTSSLLFGGQPIDPVVVAAASHVNTPLFALCLLIQLIASVFATAGEARLLPRRLRPATWRGRVLLGFLNFAVPFGGILCTLGAFALSRMLPTNRAILPVTAVEEPQFEEYLIGSVSYGRGARLKAELRNADASVDFRMTALLAMQSLPVRTVSPILQEMLADPLDDIRLLAYGSLESKEKALTHRITAERSALDAAAADGRDPQAHARHLKTLAELYGELIYQQLVTGDVFDNAIAQAEHFAEAALAMAPTDASLWRLRGRLALLRRDFDTADAMLQHAIDSGFPRDRMLPYLAEAAYGRRDFMRVRSLLGAMDRHAVTPTLQAALDFWQPELAVPASSGIRE